MSLYVQGSFRGIKAQSCRCFCFSSFCLQEPSIELELLGNFFAELTLVDYGSLKFPPSVIAASAVFLAKRTLWPDTHPWVSASWARTRDWRLRICLRRLCHTQPYYSTVPVLASGWGTPLYARHSAATPGYWTRLYPESELSFALLVTLFCGLQTSTLQHYSSYTPSYLKECIQNLHDLHCNKRRCTLPAIREKYRQAKVCPWLTTCTILASALLSTELSS